MKLQALILAGGVGKRTRPLLGDKLFLPFLGKPLISWVVESVKKAGVEKVIMVGNDKNLTALRKLFKGKEFSFYSQGQRQGMAGAILSVKKFLPLPLLVLNADDIFSPNFFKDFFAFLQKNPHQLVLTGVKKEAYFPGGYFILKDNQVKGVVEKPQKGKEPSQYVRLVVDYFQKPELLLRYFQQSQSQKDDLYERVLDRILKNEKVTFYRYEGSWATVKYPWHILDFQKLLLEEYLEKDISQKAEIARSAEIKGKVFIEEGVKIFEGAVIVGPAYIGKNSIVGNQSLIRESNIEENCLVGSGTEVARSYLGPDCWLHRNYIGDSVLEEDVRFGAGAVTANFRLDEKEIDFRAGQERFPTDRRKLGAVLAKSARVGVNASLMPGISIGENAWVGPGVVLKEPLWAGDKKKE